MRRFRLLALMLGAGTVAAACGSGTSSSGGNANSGRTLANAPVGGTIQLANVALDSPIHSGQDGVKHPHPSELRTIRLSPKYGSAAELG